MVTSCMKVSGLGTMFWENTRLTPQLGEVSACQDLVLPKAEVVMDKLDVTVDNAAGP